MVIMGTAIIFQCYANAALSKRKQCNHLSFFTLPSGSSHSLHKSQKVLLLIDSTNQSLDIGDFPAINNRLILNPYSRSHLNKAHPNPKEEEAAYKIGQFGYHIAAVYSLTMLMIAIFIDIYYSRAQTLQLKSQLDLQNQQEIKLMQIDNAKSYFLTQVCQELCNPLIMIIEPVQQLIQNDKTSKEHKTLLNIVLHNSRHMLFLTHQILELAKTESGEMDFIVEQFEYTTCLGADEYLNEPLNLDELKLHVKHQPERNIEKSGHTESCLGQRSEKDCNPLCKDEFLQKIRYLMEEHYRDDQFGVEKLSEFMCMSRNHLYRKAKSLTHQSPNELIRNFRLQKAGELLTHSPENVTQVCLEVGFNNLSYFSKCFHAFYGQYPSSYRKTGRPLA